MVSFLASTPAPLLVLSAAAGGWLIAVLLQPGRMRYSAIVAAAASAMVAFAVVGVWSQLITGEFTSPYLWTFSDGFQASYVSSGAGGFVVALYVRRLPNRTAAPRFFTVLTVLTVGLIGAAYVAAPSVVGQTPITNHSVRLFVGGANRVEVHLGWFPLRSEGGDRLAPNGFYSTEGGPLLHINLTSEPGSIVTVGLRTSLQSLLQAEPESEQLVTGIRRQAQDSRSSWQAGELSASGCDVDSQNIVDVWPGGTLTFEVEVDSQGKASIDLNDETLLQLVNRQSDDYIAQLPSIDVSTSSSCVVGFGAWRGEWMAPSLVDISIEDPTRHWPVGPKERSDAQAYENLQWSYSFSSEGAARVGPLQVIALDAVPSTATELNMFVAAFIGSVSAAAIWDLVDKWPRRGRASARSRPPARSPSTTSRGERFKARFRHASQTPPRAK